MMMTQEAPRSQSSAFVIVPFTSAAADFYADVLLPALESANFSVGRAEDIFDQPDSLRDALTRAHSADLIVVDMSQPTAGIMYLLGLAQGLLKPVVLITRHIDRLPPDLRAYQVIEYNLHYRRVSQLQAQLKAMAQQAARGELHISSPVTDFLPLLSQPDTRAALPTPTAAAMPHPAAQRVDTLTASISRLRDTAMTFADDVQQQQQTIREIRAKGVNADPREQRTVLNAATQTMDNYASNTEAELPLLHASWEKLLKSAGDLITGAASHEQSDAATALRSQLDTLQNLSAGFKTDIAHATEVIAKTPDINKNLNRARARAEVALGTLSTELTTGDSYIMRTLGLLQERAGTPEEPGANHG
jgi:hypothetical protein